MNLILAVPKTAKPPFAGALFQHGGGQSMTNYLSEALVLARAGVVSMLTDAPARGEGVAELNQTKLDESQRFQADVVISLRMALDHLLNQKGVDAKRIGFVGHSYGVWSGTTKIITSLPGKPPKDRLNWHAQHLAVPGVRGQLRDFMRP